MLWRRRRRAPPGPPDAKHHRETVRETAVPALTPSEERAIARSLYPGASDNRRFLETLAHMTAYPW